MVRPTQVKRSLLQRRLAVSYKKVMNKESNAVNKTTISFFVLHTFLVTSKKNNLRSSYELKQSRLEYYLFLVVSICFYFRAFSLLKKITLLLLWYCTFFTGCYSAFSCRFGIFKIKFLVLIPTLYWNDYIPLPIQSKIQNTNKMLLSLLIMS